MIRGLLAWLLIQLAKPVGALIDHDMRRADWSLRDWEES